MSGISGLSSGVGLISGLPTAQIIAQLMAIEARPLTLLQQQVTALQTQRGAYMDLSARLLALKSAVQRFDDELARVLKERFPADPLPVPHRAYTIVGRAP